MSRADVVLNPRRALALGRHLLLLLACLALLGLAAPLAGAQGTVGGTNVTVTFANGLVGTFEGVSGLPAPSNPSAASNPLGMPSMARMGNALLNQGSFSAGPEFWAWYNQIQMNAVMRSSVQISCTDQSGNNATWVLQNAYPTIIQANPPSSGGDSVQVQALDICFESAAVQP
ncbi:MAG: phage tail protein [Pseudomonadota bacterium]